MVKTLFVSEEHDNNLEEAKFKRIIDNSTNCLIATPVTEIEAINRYFDDIQEAEEIGAGFRNAIECEIYLTPPSYLEDLFNGNEIVIIC